jgi:hypothetical protein
MTQNNNKQYVAMKVEVPFLGIFNPEKSGSRITGLNAGESIRLVEVDGKYERSEMVSLNGLTGPFIVGYFRTWPKQWVDGAKKYESVMVKNKEGKDVRLSRGGQFLVPAVEVNGVLQPKPGLLKPAEPKAAKPAEAAKPVVTQEALAAFLATKEGQAMVKAAMKSKK